MNENQIKKLKDLINDAAFLAQGGRPDLSKLPTHKQVDPKVEQQKEIEQLKKKYKSFYFGL